MDRITKIRNFTLKALISLFFCVFAYLLAALIGGLMVVHANRSPDMGDVVIYLVSNGVHTDIVMPVQNDIYDWRRVVSPEHTYGKQQDVKYVGIGWGDRGFYLESPTWADLKVSTALKAITGAGGSAMHVTFYAQEPTEHVNSLRIHITAAEYERLVLGILPSFRFQNEQTVPISDAYYHDSDAFYEATGTYHAFHTCNTWTNTQLKKSGLKAVIWTPFASSLMRIYRHHD